MTSPHFYAGVPRANAAFAIAQEVVGKLH